MGSKKDEYIAKYKEMCDTVVEDGDAIFFSKHGSDFGIEVMDSDPHDDEWQLWMGDIELWDDYAEERSYMNMFQK